MAADTEPVEVSFRFADGTEYKLNVPCRILEVAKIRRTVEGYVRLAQQMPGMMIALKDVLVGHLR